MRVTPCSNSSNIHRAKVGHQRRNARRAARHVPAKVPLSTPRSRTTNGNVARASGEAIVEVREWLGPRCSVNRRELEPRCCLRDTVCSSPLSLSLSLSVCPLPLFISFSLYVYLSFSLLLGLSLSPHLVPSLSPCRACSAPRSPRALPFQIASRPLSGGGGRPGHCHDIFDLQGFIVYPGVPLPERLRHDSGAPWVLPFPAVSSQPCHCLL